MGILNIDEHVEEHRLMAIRYPSKAVIPGQSVIAQSNIPFLIMPGDGASAGCSFSGTAGDFTLSAAIIANIGTTLAGCYAYFSADFGGGTLPAGWYWTEFSSDTAGIVYANTYTSGVPLRPVTKTPISENLTGRITATTNEVVGPSGFVMPGDSLGKNGVLQALLTQAGSTASTKTYRVKVDSTTAVITGTTTSPTGETLHTITCADSHTSKLVGRSSTSVITGVGVFSTSYAAASAVEIATDSSTTLSISLQGASNVAAPILSRAIITATYGK